MGGVDNELSESRVVFSVSKSYFATPSFIYKLIATLADKTSDLFTTGHIKSAGQSSTVSRQPENRLSTFTNPSAKASLDTYGYGLKPLIGLK